MNDNDKKRGEEMKWEHAYMKVVCDVENLEEKTKELFNNHIHVRNVHISQGGECKMKATTSLDYKDGGLKKEIGRLMLIDGVVEVILMSGPMVTEYLLSLEW